MITPDGAPSATIAIRRAQLVPAAPHIHPQGCVR